MFLHIRVFFFDLSFTAYEKAYFIFADMWFIFWALKVKPRLCSYNPIDRRDVTFLHTMETLKLYIYLCCYFTFVWFHFSALCGDSAARIVWLGLGTKTHLVSARKRSCFGFIGHHKHLRRCPEVVPANLPDFPVRLPFFHGQFSCSSPNLWHLSDHSLFLAL